jgi:hypothetical protein
MEMYVGDKIKQTQEELRAKGVKYCIGAYVDIHGVPKAKVVPLGHLEHMAHGSTPAMPSTDSVRSRTTTNSPRSPISITSSSCRGSRSLPGCRPISPSRECHMP